MCILFRRQHPTSLCILTIPICMQQSAPADVPLPFCPSGWRFALLLFQNRQCTGGSCPCACSIIAEQKYSLNPSHVQCVYPMYYQQTQSSILVFICFTVIYSSLCSARHMPYMGYERERLYCKQKTVQCFLLFSGIKTFPLTAKPLLFSFCISSKKRRACSLLEVTLLAVS